MMDDRMDITWCRPPRRPGRNHWYIYNMLCERKHGDAQSWTDPDEVGILHDTGEILIGSDYTEAQGQLIMAAFLESLNGR